MSDDKQRLAQRIVKLFALGNSASNTSEAETEAAITKARQLMMEHALTMDDLASYAGQAGQAVAIKLTTASCYTLKQKFAVYDDFVGQAVGLVTDTRTYTKIRWDDGKRFWSRYFVGTELDVAIAGELFQVLMDSMRRQARYRLGPGWSAKHARYCEGFSQRLVSRAQQAYNEKVPQEYALVLRNKQTAVEDWYSKNVVTKVVQLKTTPETLTGYADGAYADLGDPRHRIR